MVCDGGDNPLIQQKVIQAVTTALDITSTRVCVIPVSYTHLAKITEIDFDKKRVSLSIKALLEPVAQENSEEEQAE